MNIKENQFDSLVIFSDKLRQFKIPIDKWGQKRAKTVENLYNEIISRESNLVVIDEVLVRELAFVNIDVFATINEQRYRLREDRQVFNVNSSNSRTRIRKLGGAVKEKIHFL